MVGEKAEKPTVESGAVEINGDIELDDALKTGFKSIKTTNVETRVECETDNLKIIFSVKMISGVPMASVLFKTKHDGFIDYGDTKAAIDELRLLARGAEMELKNVASATIKAHSIMMEKGKP